MRPSRPRADAVQSSDFLLGSGLNAMMKTWQTFWRLSGFERGIALEAAVALAATWAGLRLVGFRRWQRVLEWLAPGAGRVSPLHDAGVLDSARTIARMEEAAARHVFFRTNCLEQSLVLWWLLRARGIFADLRIGARKDADRFEAHAWVELTGNALSGANNGHLHFVPFDGPLISVETQSH
jgi:hypothetical protein